jgi:hypothetical protein
LTGDPHQEIASWHALSPKRKKNAVTFPPSKTIAEQILTNAQDSRPVVQHFVPLAEVSTES